MSGFPTTAHAAQSCHCPKQSSCFRATGQEWSGESGCSFPQGVLQVGLGSFGVIWHGRDLGDPPGVATQRGNCVREPRLSAVCLWSVPAPLGLPSVLWAAPSSLGLLPRQLERAGGTVTLTGDIFRASEPLHQMSWETSLPVKRGQQTGGWCPCAVLAPWAMRVHARRFGDLAGSI